MGNRANVIFTDGKTISPAVYLHWNGGPESVYAFLDELDARRVRGDGSYDAARFAQIVGEFMDQDSRTGLSLGIMNGPKTITLLALAAFDQGDNGVYVVRRHGDTRTVRRFHADYHGDTFVLRELTPAEVEREAT